jgi:hypothetical protein
MSKKIYFLLLCFLGPNYSFFSQLIKDNTSQELLNITGYKSNKLHSERKFEASKLFKNRLRVPSYKAYNDWAFFQGREKIVNIGVLGSIDSYGYPGFGVEFGLSQIRNNGFTISIYSGVTPSPVLWLGGGLGYTLRMSNLAPYGLVGGSIAYSNDIEEIVTSGSLEIGTNIRISDWFSLKPALRSSLGRLDDNEYYYFNFLIFSAVFDLMNQIPYW